MFYAVYQCSDIVGYNSAYLDRSSMTCLSARYLPVGAETQDIAISKLITNASMGKGADSGKPTADKIYVWTGATYDIYFYHTSGQWRKAGATVAQDETAETTDTIPFGSAFFYKKGTLTRGDYTMAGEVFNGDSISVTLNRSQMAFVAYPWPMDATLETIAACITNPGTGADSSKPTADRIYKWNGATYDIYYHQTNGWCLDGTTTVVTPGTVTFASDEGFFVKKGSLKAGTITFANPLKK